MQLPEGTKKIGLPTVWFPWQMTVYPAKRVPSPNNRVMFQNNSILSPNDQTAGSTPTSYVSRPPDESL